MIPWETSTAVLGLAVLDTLSPAVLGVTIYLLVSRPQGIVRLLAAYLGTVALAYFALGIALMLGLTAVLSALDSTEAMWIQAGVGVALFIGSWWVPGGSNGGSNDGGAAEGSRGAGPESGAVRRMRSSPLTVLGMVALGLGTWLFECATALPYFGAVGIMLAAELGPPQWLVLLAAYVTVMVLPGIILPVCWSAAGTRFRAAVQQWRERRRGGSGAWLGWAMGIVGVLMALNAFSRLFG